jgi:hypothetical protein
MKTDLQFNREQHLSYQIKVGKIVGIKTDLPGKNPQKLI